MVLYVQERGAFGFADRFVGHGHFTQGLTFVVVGGCAGGRDEFVGILAVGGPTVIHGIFIRIENKPVGLLLFNDNTFVNLDVTTFSVTDKIGIINELPLSIISPSRYLLVKYADSITGTGISNAPAGKSYFGLLASDILYGDRKSVV